MILGTIGQLIYLLLFSQVYMNIGMKENEMTNPNLEAEVTQLHAEICAGLADPNRILILYALSQGPRNVTELCNELNMTQPLVSRHLKILRERGMVTTERRGTVIIYSLGDNRLIEALDLLRAAMREIMTRRAALVEAIAE
jgi:DNA-binding transcriptional ArsR family regulator